ncbi:MAG: cobalt ECF transporter T component CbiQ [Gemmataceae bacterium]|nr:cobalt ECF transporter T component CbiQ [Gemmataceae bacterium]MDW8266304.1 cobalt ECF transporter T component CbiQ [Gemmataceae bacterium]
MTLQFVHLADNDSWLGRRDARWKLAGVLLAAVVATSLHRLFTSGIALIAASLLVAVARLPSWWLRERLAVVGWLIGPMVLLLPWLPAGAGPVWHWGAVRLSWSGLNLALLLALKATTLAFLWCALAGTTPLPSLLHAAQALRVPGIVVHLVLLTYRYVFLLADELARLRIALYVRGFRANWSWRSWRVIGQLAGILMLRSHDRAERVGQAMRCRGFDGRFRSLVCFQTSASDLGLFAALVGTAAWLWIWDRA